MKTKLLIAAVVIALIIISLPCWAQIITHKVKYIYPKNIDSGCYTILKDGIKRNGVIYDISDTDGYAAYKDCHGWTIRDAAKALDIMWKSDSASFARYNKKIDAAEKLLATISLSGFVETSYQKAYVKAANNYLKINRDKRRVKIVKNQIIITK